MSTENKGFIPQIMNQGNAQDYRHSRLTPEIIGETFRDLLINRDPSQYLNPYWNISEYLRNDNIEDDDDDIYIK